MMGKFHFTEKELRKISAIFVIIVFSLCSQNLYAQDTSATEQTDYPVEYRIGPRDLLEISVFGQDELNTRVRVSEEGKITFPLLGEVSVGGMTKTEAETELKRLLEEGYLQNPQVTIFILEYQSKRVSILGAVRNPGRYELLGRETLLEIIAQAGGFTPEAGDGIIITRENNHGTKKVHKVSIEDLTLKEDAKVDMPLEPNDTIYIPPDRLVTIYVTGRVNNPGALEIRESLLPNFTLLRAIAMAGGFAERASKGGVKLKRVDENGREKTMKINVKDIEKGKKKDIPLKENDVIIVPETIF